jgi:DNA-binding NtrC family response regulator
MRKYSLETRRNVVRLSKAALQQLEAYDWPGNIRELEHLIERSVLMAKGSELDHFNLPAAKKLVTPAKEGPIKPMEEMERDHIMAALKASNGKVFGPGGAAEILKMPAATLYSKMKRLGIKIGYE